MKYKKECIPEYQELIRKDSYLHVIVNRDKREIHTINQCFYFDSKQELKTWIDNSLFTAKQILIL